MTQWIDTYMTDGIEKGFTQYEEIHIPMFKSNPTVLTQNREGDFLNEMPLPTVPLETFNKVWCSIVTAYLHSRIASGTYCNDQTMDGDGMIQGIEPGISISNKYFFMPSWSLGPLGFVFSLFRSVWYLAGDPGNIDLLAQAQLLNNAFIFHDFEYGIIPRTTYNISIIYFQYKV